MELYVPRDTIVRKDKSVCEGFVLDDGRSVFESGVYDSEFQNQCGLDSVIEHYIVMLDRQINCGLYHSNVFTPCGDGLNDIFQGHSVSQVKTYNLQIQDRWRNIMYETSNLHNGWDGNFNGEPAPPEVYAYLVRVRLPNGDIGDFKGDVTLIR